MNFDSNFFFRKLMEKPILMNLGNTNIPFYDVLGLVENMGETWKQSMSSVRVDFSATDKLKTGSHLHLNLVFFSINKKYLIVNEL